MAKETVGFAILGAGMVADYHYQAIKANAEAGARLVAVGHHEPQRFEEIGHRFGVPCLSQDELLAKPEVDVVCICTPNSQHAAQALAAIRAGKHVLVEKPMALSLTEADAMIQASQETGVKLGVVLQRRTEPLFKAVYDAIATGDLGELTLGVITIPYYRSQSYYQQAAWRSAWGSGVLMSQGIHLLDLLVWYMGDPVEAHAFGATLHRQLGVEDTLAASLKFANGSLATIIATTTAAPGFPHRLELYGTGGGIQLEGEGAIAWQLADPTQARITPPALSKAADAGAGGDPRGISPTGHINIVRDFIAALHEGRRPAVDGAEGRRSLAAVLAVYRAAGLVA
ncbi:MAG: Gfo/Idh/MocA family oxidoreductase [Truepera sp.]|nr:Gfo/Idh/MocA family oxidoreductase [Truepera sp.]